VTPERLFVFASISTLSYVVASRGIHTYNFHFYRPRSLAVSGALQAFRRHSQSAITSVRPKIGDRQVKEGKLIIALTFQSLFCGAFQGIMVVVAVRHGVG
jgi:hypothetical protein